MSVTPEAKAVVDKLCDDTGMSVTRLVSAVYLWFAEQDDLTQRAILKLLPKDLEPDIAKMVLQKMAADTVKSHRLAGRLRQKTAALESATEAETTQSQRPISRKPEAAR